LDPDLRKAGDSGKPVVLEGEDSPSAQSLYQFARQVIARVAEIKASESEGVIHVQ
jgi:MinD-like ATPase involved in chromosome partitioning or flagellar assembly